MPVVQWRDCRGPCQEFIKAVGIGGHIFVKVGYVVLLLARLVSLFVSIYFDQICVISERASIVNCTQEVFIYHPMHWIMFWISSSIISSFLLIVILWLNKQELNYKFSSLKRLLKKGSFWSFNVLFLLTLLSYIIRIVNSVNGMSMAFSILLFFWSPVTLSVVYFLNYLSPVKAPSRKGLKTMFMSFLVYWFTLFVYIAETSCMVLALMVDSVLHIVPLIKEEYQEQARRFSAFILIGFGIRVAFKTRLLAFFWNKMFHGHMDLFSEPNIKLERDDETEEVQEAAEALTSERQSDNESELGNREAV